MTTQKLDAVVAKLAAYPSVAVAVSGGVDSLTLATIASRHHASAEMFHAVSPAVPPEATERVRNFASREGWQLRVINAGEFESEAYLANPVNRCFYCKQSLYAAIGAIAGATSAQIVSGTNADDLGEYRPGLDAAKLYDVRHPFSELALGKQDVRALASALGLHDVAHLPAAPCLSSRVESGIRIDASMLQDVHRVEKRVRALVPQAKSIRCRIRAAGVVIEIDEQTLMHLDKDEQDYVLAAATSVLRAAGPPRHVSLAPYKSGSAFLVHQLTHNSAGTHA